MADYAKLHKMIQNALKQSAEESSMLLNQELEVGDTELLERDKHRYLAEMDDSAFVIGVESREDYPGHFHMVFSLRDAILMSGILLGIPAGRISEKKKLLILEADDIDAFSEIGNQIIGSFNSVFQPCLPNKVHLKQLPPTKFVPQVDEVTDDSPFPEGDYLTFKAQIRLGGNELNRFDILVPLHLANLFDPQAEAPVAANDAESAAPDQAESLRKMFPGDGGAGAADWTGGDGTSRTVLILEDDPADCELVKQLLSSKGFTAVTAPLGADIQAFFSDSGVSLVILGTVKAEEWELSLCSRIRELAGKSNLPIIMSARQWTRTGVLKAITNGALDIVMKPYLEDDLSRKLGKFLSAA